MSGRVTWVCCVCGPFFLLFAMVLYGCVKWLIDDTEVLGTESYYMYSFS